MGKLHLIGRISIKVYAGDHLPPHFHAMGPNGRAKIEIETFGIIYSTLRSKELKTVMAWAEQNQSALIAEWNRVTNYPIA